jgi:tetratricopeptide (TPR) repeat protein
MRPSLILLALLLLPGPLAAAPAEPESAEAAPSQTPASPTGETATAPPPPSPAAARPDPIAPGADEAREEQELCSAWLAEKRPERAALAYALRPDEGLRASLNLAEPYPVKQEIERGHLLFQGGRFEAAAEAYAMLYAARPQLVRVLFNVAQAFRRARQEREALAFYRRYLRAEPQSPLRQEVQGYVGELSALLAARALSEAPRPAPKPVYRRPWFWVLLGLTTAGVATAIGLGVTLGNQPPPPQTPVLGPYTVMFPPGGM